MVEEVRELTVKRTVGAVAPYGREPAPGWPRGTRTLAYTVSAAAMISWMIQISS